MISAWAAHDVIMAPMTSVMKWAYATILETATMKENVPATAKPMIDALIPAFSLLKENNIGTEQIRQAAINV